MNCPKCEQQILVSRQVRGIQVDQFQVDQCQQCGGVWCDPTELAKLLALGTAEAGQVASGRPDARVSARAGKCPRDGRKMIRVASAKKRDVILETCPECRGVWLDGGELKLLLQA